MLRCWFHSPAGGRTAERGRPLGRRILMAAALVTGALSATADVGLPTYADPAFYHSEAPAVSTSDVPSPLLSVESHVVARPISISGAAACDTATSDQHSGRSALDFALPADFRPLLHEDSDEAGAEIPLIIRGTSALMHTGSLLNKASVRLQDGRLLLTSGEESFFNSLQGIQIGDRLLVHTSHTLHQYRITSARLTHGLNPDTDSGDESLSLVTCYPFQPVGSTPIFYELRAQPLQANLQYMRAHSEDAPSSLINF